MEKRKKVGQYAHELLQKTPDSVDPIEIQRVLLDPNRYEKELMKCIEEGKKAYEGDFFVETYTIIMPFMRNAPYWRRFVRRSCPTPAYNQTVHHYIKSSDRIEFIWEMPDMRTALWLYENALTAPLDQKQLVGYVLDYYNDNLTRKAKQLNNEDFSSILIH